MLASLKLNITETALWQYSRSASASIKRHLFCELLSSLKIKMPTKWHLTLAKLLLTISFLVSSEIPCVYRRLWIGAVFRYAYINSLEYISFRLTLTFFIQELHFVVYFIYFAIMFKTLCLIWSKQWTVVWERSQNPSR
jgi:hypothetical protein